MSNYVGVNADFAGCEIIVAAGLSGDRDLYQAETSSKCHRCQGNPCECGKEHIGLHWLSAHLTFGDNAVKEQRYKAKAVTFRKLFGGQPEDKVAEQIAEIFDTQVAPGYAAWDRWLRECYKRGSLVYRDYTDGTNWEVPPGDKYEYKQPGPEDPVDEKGNRLVLRREARYEVASYGDSWRDRRAIYRTYSGRNVYVSKGPHAFGNGAIQGTARELLADALIEWRPISKMLEAQAVLPVHDEILTWVPKKYMNEENGWLAARLLQSCMESTVLSVPGWEVKVGADPELREFSYWPDSSLQVRVPQLWGTVRP